MSKIQKIKIKCPDGVYDLSYAVAASSKMLCNCFKLTKSDLKISLPLTKKSLFYLEFVIVNGFLPPMSFQDLVKAKEGNGYVTWPKQNLDIQIITTEAFAFLDISEHIFTSYMDSVLDGIYYQEKGIDYQDVSSFVKKFCGAGVVKDTLTQKSAIMLEVLRLFKKNENNLLEYINEFIKS